MSPPNKFPMTSNPSAISSTALAPQKPKLAFRNETNFYQVYRDQLLIIDLQDHFNMFLEIKDINTRMVIVERFLLLQTQCQFCKLMKHDHIKTYVFGTDLLVCFLHCQKTTICAVNLVKWPIRFYAWTERKEIGILRSPSPGIFVGKESDFAEHCKVVWYVQKPVKLVWFDLMLWYTNVSDLVHVGSYRSTYKLFSIGVATCRKINTRTMMLVSATYRSKPEVVDAEINTNDVNLKDFLKRHKTKIFYYHSFVAILMFRSPSCISLYKLFKDGSHYKIVLIEGDLNRALQVRGHLLAFQGKKSIELLKAPKNPEDGVERFVVHMSADSDALQYERK